MITNTLRYRLLEILYSPSGYIHPAHLPNEFIKVDDLSSQILNHWIIKHFSLDSIGDWLPDSDVITMLISSWHNIPSIAILIGAFLSRDILLANCELLFSLPTVLSFISLPIIHNKIHLDYIEVNRTNLFHIGTIFILNLCSHLPKGLIKRIQLYLPPLTNRSTFVVANTPENFNLFMMAIRYANNIQR